MKFETRHRTVEAVQVLRHNVNHHRFDDLLKLGSMAELIVEQAEAALVRISPGSDPKEISVLPPPHINWGLMLRVEGGVILVQQDDWVVREGDRLFAMKWADFERTYEGVDL